MNIYAGAPEDMAERVQEAATKALANEIEAAIKKLHQGSNGRFQATIMLLGSLIGEED